MKSKIACIITVIIAVIFTGNIFAEDGISKSSNLISFDNYINIDKDVEGDVYTFGQTISVGKDVSGDVISAAKDININTEEVKGNIRTASQNLLIDVIKTNNITVTAEIINISENTNSNAIYAAAKEITFKGNTNDFYASGETIIIDGIINGELNVQCDTLVLKENAEVMGGINVKSPNQPVMNSKITLDDINYEKVSKNNNEDSWFSKSNLSWTLMSIATAILLGFIIYILFRQSFIGVKSNFDGILKYLLIGLATLIIVPIASIVMMITIIGIPIGIISLILYGIIMYLCPIIVGIILGKILFRKNNDYIQILGGIIIIKCMLLIPYISFIAWILSELYVMGVISIKIYLSLNRKIK